MGTHQKHLTNVILTSTHNICFHGEKKKNNSPFLLEKNAISAATDNDEFVNQSSRSGLHSAIWIFLSKRALPQEKNPNF